MKRRAPLTELPAAAPAGPERTALHDAAERNGCPLERCMCAEQCRRKSAAP